ncbi:LytR/AlgR family response regulator transcription factor [Siphonobacter aquaeclarae]|uniref:Two component transcriptional regulator, LytTR family n=1 Tax=Siphonobacter aquaeclarae TaxID=563176 RepID=A0A1G9HRP7_9BACT|nr:LytTR family DNA-binding domain-containing protein [Siphonobacter aquaeclarae]SDL15476.1 two component transcriptional regulator, LytTR family [Siphonobacter aquaeclarae]
MTILIVEDEKPNAARLRRILTELGGYRIVGILETIRESLEWLQEQPAPDVILMDIRLSDGLSFDLFAQTDIRCPVIFTTAYDEYAVRAFRVNGLDYLLKPIEKEELKLALQKVKPAGNLAAAGVEDLLKLFRSSSALYRRRFLLPSFDGFKTVPVEQIAYVYSEYKVTHLTLMNGQVEAIPQSMDELEEELDPDPFFRANRQFIIHVNSIDVIRNSFNGKLLVLLRDGTEVMISREKAPVFKAWLDR